MPKTIKEIESKENLKPIKLEDLKVVTEVLNEYWFAEPVKTTQKATMAVAIGDLALWDHKFVTDYFTANPEAETTDFDNHIKAIEDHNNELSDEDYEEKAKDAPMISPFEIEDAENNGLSNTVLKTILDLTGVNYLTLYGFDDELSEELSEEVVPEEEKEEVPEQPKETEITEELIEEAEEKFKEPEEQDIEEQEEINTPKGDLGVHSIDFAEALSKVEPGLGKEETEQLIRFEKDYIRTYSSNVSVYHPFTTGITGSVSGKELIALIKKLPDQELNLIQMDDRLKVKGKSVDAEFNFNSLIMSTVDVPGKHAEWHDLPNEFAEQLQFASLSASSRAPVPVYNCVVVENDRIYACENGVKGIEIEIGEGFNGKMNIFAKFAKELIKYNPHSVCLEGSHFHFMNAQGTIISLRKYAEGEFTQAFFDNLREVGIEIEIPKGTKSVLERSAIFSGKGFRDYVEIKIHGGWMHIHGKNETGCVKDKIKINKEDIEADFCIQPTLFQKIIGSAFTLEICEKFIVFRGASLTCWVSKVIPT